MPHPSFAHPLPQGARVIKVPFWDFDRILFVGFHPTYQLTVIFSQTECQNILLLNFNKFEPHQSS